MTRTRVPADVSTRRPRSPLVALVGLSTTVPVRRTTCPSVASLGAAGAELDRGWTLPERADRSCRLPQVGVRAGRMDRPTARGPPARHPVRADRPLRQLHDDPARRVGDREQRWGPKATGLRGDDTTDRHGRSDRAGRAVAMLTTTGPGVGLADGDGVGAGVDVGAGVGVGRVGLAQGSGRSSAGRGRRGRRRCGRR